MFPDRRLVAASICSGAAIGKQRDLPGVILDDLDLPDA
jgi:hypothetical protein